MQKTKLAFPNVNDADLEQQGGKSGSKNLVAKAECPVRVVGAVGVTQIGKKLDTVIHLQRM